MCYRLIEVYAVCKCVYFIHGIDQCNSFGTHGHSIQDRTVLVGCTCPSHHAVYFSSTSYTTSPPSSSSSSSSYQYPSSITSSNSNGSLGGHVGQGGISAQIRQLQQQQQQQQAQYAAYYAPRDPYTAQQQHGYSG